MPSILGSSFLSLFCVFVAVCFAFNIFLSRVLFFPLLVFLQTHFSHFFFLSGSIDWSCWNIKLSSSRSSLFSVFVVKAQESLSHFFAYISCMLWLMYDIRLDWSADDDVRRCNTRLDDTTEEKEEVQRTLNETIQVD